MSAFLVLCVVGLVGVVVLGAITTTVLHALVWVVTLPFRIFFKLLFGLGGVLAGVVLAPALALIVAIALIVSIVGAVIALLAPLLPVILLACFGWAIFRLASGKPAAAPPPPPPGFWS